jgi:hypothetical protein
LPREIAEEFGFPVRIGFNLAPVLLRPPEISTDIVI